MSNSLARSSPSMGHMVCAILSPARQRFQRASDMSALEPSVPTGVSRIKAALRTCSPPGECSPGGISRGSHPIEARLFCRSDGVEHVEPSHASTL
jgi:hypothetical protein